MVAALALFAAACGDDSGSSSATTAAGGDSASTTAASDGGAGTTAGEPVSGTLQGSGSTFQLAYQQEAAAEFGSANSGATITYGGGGSGKGRTDLTEKTVDFAGSDAGFKDEEKPADPILYFPVLLGPITMSFNVSGVDTLQLSAETIAGIFQRQITKWNDPKIAADNEGADLPDTDITVVHRSDGSGTTQNFTEWLSVAAPDVWTIKPGSTVEWPADTQAGNGNQGVAQIVQSTDGAIGYVDFSDAVASGLKFASVKNASGDYIEPSAESARAAGEGIEIAPDLLFKAYNSPAPDAYPITYQSWVIVYQNQTDPAKGALLKAYLNYLLTDGQALLPDLDYAPLSKTIQDKAIAQLDQLQIG
jgi:phosphate transport system substrate-binding protein